MRRLLLALLVAAAPVLASCAASGDDRPRLGERVDELPFPPQLTDDPQLDALLGRLDRAPSTTFTARWSLLRKLGGLEGVAEVAHEPERTAVRVGDALLIDGPQPQTCEVAAQTCRPELASEALSMFALSPDFWGPAMATRVRVSATRLAGEVSFDSRTVNGTAVDCAVLPVGAGVETYCVTAEGLLAFADLADLTITLLESRPEVDPAAFDVASYATAPAG